LEGDSLGISGQKEKWADRTLPSIYEESSPSTRPFGETIRFGVVGITNTSVDFLLFLSLTSIWSWNVLAAQTVSYLFGLVNSYIWNRKVTFKSQEKPNSGEILRFISVNLVSYLISILVLLIMEYFSVSNVLSKFIVIFFTFGINFAGSKWWVFRRQRVEQNL
jgi:putative flippase GtrA